MQYKA